MNADHAHERARLDLLRALESTLGHEEANTLMRHLPPVTWDEVATNAHVTTTAERLREDVTALGTGLGHEMHSLRLELRHEMAELGAGLRIEMERGFRRQIMWLGTLGTAWFGIAVTVLQLMR
jgi:hypothetical protein